MATITEDYVSFEIAKLLKEKKFNEPTVCVYHKNGTFERIALNAWNDKFITPICAPTLQMAMKWLREVHKLVITVSIGNENNKGNTDYSNPDRWFYFFDITNAKGVVIDTEYDPLSNEFPTYEEACKVAIKYCLENLI